jgi:hypothetical protein
VSSSRCTSDGFHREVAPCGGDARSRGFDDRRSRAADAYVEVRPGSVGDAERLEDPLDEAQPPVLRLVALVAGELRVEVLALIAVLR